MAANGIGIQVIYAEGTRALAQSILAIAAWSSSAGLPMLDNVSMTDGEQPEYEFDIAVSFAGEDRDYVFEIVDAVKGDMKVFYDEDYQVEAWGEDGVEYFTNAYLNRARFAVLFVSQHYAEKMWTTVERRSALARAVTQRDAYLLPIRLDDTRLDGLLPTVIYLDSRRLGVDGVIQAIKSKVGGARPAAPARALLDGKVPRSQEAIKALMAERVGPWEHLLYGGLLKINMDSLEPKYKDFAIGYARRNGRHVGRDQLMDYVDSAMGSIGAIVDNFNTVLDIDVHERAFGAPGVPGDPDRIVHLAERFISVYEDFMDWAAELRGTSTSLRAGSEVLRTLARWAEQPVAECRRFVSAFVAELDTVTERAEAGEDVRIEMAVTLELDPAIVDEFQEKLRAALKDDD